ncbi:Isochorismatase-like protein [Lipomyces japonicus]|uniref:Isochorismatase-like protein n=1 Tax=Lipomyces japonicus TaxID=56871 RepID=UPI0034CD6F7F
MTVDSQLIIADARPAAFSLPVGRTALIIIDMQRDFLLPSGYGAIQCPSPEIFAQVSGLIKPCADVLKAARKLGMTIVHTREGHVSDLSDCPPTKRDRQLNANKRHVLCIGDEGPMGRLLVRGAYGHDIVDDLTPRKDEVILDKPGKGCFYNTDLHELLVARRVTHLIFMGVTAECCVATTFREANDHGFECCVLTDCTGGFNNAIVSATKDMFCAYDGLLGYSSTSSAFLKLANQAFPKQLAQLEPTGASSSLLAIASLHDSLINKSTTVTTVLTQVYDSITASSSPLFANIVSKKAALIKAGEIDNSAKELDDRLDLPILSGVPFAATNEFKPDATIINHLQDLGAVYLGELASHDVIEPVLKLGVASFVLTSVPSLKLPSSLVMHISSKGSLPTTGVNLLSPSTSTITTVGLSVLDLQTVWAELLRVPTKHDDEPFFQHFRQRPVISIDYRGFELGQVRYATPSSAALQSLLPFAPAVDKFDRAVAGLLAKVADARLVPGTEIVDYGILAAATLARAPSSIISIESAISSASASASTAVETIQNLQATESAKAKIYAGFNSGIESPDFIFLPYNTSDNDADSKQFILTAIEAIGGGALLVGDVLVVSQKGADARVLDFGVVVN